MLAPPYTEARKTFARLSSPQHQAKLGACTCAECAAMAPDEITIKRKWSYVYSDVLGHFFAHIGGTPAKLPEDQLDVALPVLWEVLDELDRTSDPWVNLKVG